MDQSPKAKFLRAKYIARERERQWYWRVYMGLKTCCLPEKDKIKDKQENIFMTSPSGSIPRLVKIERIEEVYKENCKRSEEIRRLVELECNEAIHHMVDIHREMVMNRLRVIKYLEEIKNQAEIKYMVQIEQGEQVKQDYKPAWARRRHYYNANAYEHGPKFGEEERLPNYKPLWVDHMDQGCKPWARRRHYYNQAQYEECFSNHTDTEVHPQNISQDRSLEWARRRNYYNVNKDTITDITVKDDYKPWARRRHYYNEAGHLDGSDVRPIAD